MENSKKITLDGTIKFSEPKKIDYRKYIEQKKQIFVNTNLAAIAILKNN